MKLYSYHRNRRLPLTMYSYQEYSAVLHRNGYQILIIEVYSYILGIEDKIRICNNSYLTKIELFELFHHFIQYGLPSSIVLLHKLTYFTHQLSMPINLITASKTFCLMKGLKGQSWFWLIGFSLSLGNLRASSDQKFK